MLSNYKYCDDDFNPNGLGFQLPPKSYDLAFDLDKDDKPAVDTQSMPRPPLRSKHGMYFSGHHSAVQSAVGSDFGFPVPAAQSAHFRPPAPSHMLGSTLRSSLDPSMAHSFSRKTYSPIEPPNLPSDVIAALSDAQLYLNPIHRRLQCKYAELSETLTKYVGRDLAESHTVQSNVVPDIYQGVQIELLKLGFC
jgi:hypothetical protein